MDGLALIDSIFESIPINEVNGRSRFEILLYVFSRLKTVNFTTSDFDEKTALYLKDKLTSKLTNDHLSSLQEVFIAYEIRQTANMTLSKEKPIEKPKVKEAEPVVAKAPVIESEDYNPETDVLEEEGLLEPPPKRGIIYDIEFMKTLGLTPDE